MVVKQKKAVMDYEYFVNIYGISEWSKMKYSQWIHPGALYNA
jgi:poly-D-alanine transfer protein DltD